MLQIIVLSITILISIYDIKVLLEGYHGLTMAWREKEWSFFTLILVCIFILAIIFANLWLSAYRVFN